jgi:hypothetical protein
MTENVQNYETKLRLWYLARLRKYCLNLEIANQSTPNTLMGADKLAIRKKLLERAANTETGLERTNHVRLADVKLILISLTLAGITVALLLVLS